MLCDDVLVVIAICHLRATVQDYRRHLVSNLQARRSVNHDSTSRVETARLAIHNVLEVFPAMSKPILSWLNARLVYSSSTATTKTYLSPIVGIIRPVLLVEKSRHDQARNDRRSTGTCQPSHDAV